MVEEQIKWCYVFVKWTRRLHVIIFSSSFQPNSKLFVLFPTTNNGVRVVLLVSRSLIFTDKHKPLSLFSELFILFCKEEKKPNFRRSFPFQPHAHAHALKSISTNVMCLSGC